MRKARGYIVLSVVSGRSIVAILEDRTDDVTPEDRHAVDLAWRLFRNVVPHLYRTPVWSWARYRIKAELKTYREEMRFEDLWEERKAVAS